MKLEGHGILEEKMNKTISVLKEELSVVRAGRANPRMLDKIIVDYYGSATPLKQLATVSAPEPRTIMVQPWDATALESVEKAISSSDLGFNPTNDGKVIRISVPQLTEERRKELIKHVHKIAENAKVALRNERRDANEGFKKMQKNSEITEDDLKSAQDEVQKMTDSNVKMVDELIKVKEKEIMEV
ncbi:MAG: ribosome recycling factor [Peptostreptococcaceae bacterium]|jgi:ribosome recycling factor|nr:ribosome recycling factor [Peptostreptococcaceae bacterium]